MDEALGTWGQSFISTPINLTTTPHAPCMGPQKCFSHDSVEELHSHQQQDHQFIIKDKSGNSQVKRCRGQGMGKECRAPMFSAITTLSLNLHVFVNWKLSKPGPFRFLWGPHCIGMLD